MNIRTLVATFIEDPKTSIITFLDPPKNPITVKIITRNMGKAIAASTSKENKREEGNVILPS